MTEKRKKLLSDLTKGMEYAILFESRGGRRSAHATFEGDGDGFLIFSIPHFAEDHRFSGLEAAWVPCESLLAAVPIGEGRPEAFLG